MRAKNKIGDVVWIEFNDHCTGNHGWTRYDYCHHNIMPCYCVGFFVRESKEYLTLSLLMGEDKEDGPFSETFSVIKKCITKRKTLKKRK